MNVLVELVSCLQHERDSEGCDANIFMDRVREAVRETVCVLGEHVWSDDNFEDALKLMIDTGASTHMTNSRDTLMHGTVVACDVQVMGVGGTPMHVTEKGSVSLVVGGRELVLGDVLLAESAHLGAGPVHEPQVLVGVRKFARDTGLGLSFPADGRTMCVFDKDECIATAETDDSALYVIRRRDLASGQSRIASVNVALSVPSGSREYTKTLHNSAASVKVPLSVPNGSMEDTKNMLQSEATSVKVLLTAPRGPGVNTEITGLGTTARVYPATAQDRARSDSQENASSARDFVTAQDRARLDVTAVKVDEGKAEGVKTQRKYTAKERKAFGKLMHSRMHFGHSSNVKSALKKAYGDRYEEDEDPCTPCMWAKARMHTRSKTHRRAAQRLGDRLHYDMFHGPCRSEERYKYVLVVIDEWTSKSWTVGLTRKSELYGALKAVIAEVETRMRGERVRGLATGNADQPHVVEVRSDNAKENVLKSMQALFKKNGTRMETSVPYQQWQNGKAERLGGYIMKGGRALQYGGYLREPDWFKCVRAFNHIRNRMPNSNSKHHDGRTPYELWHDERIPLDAQLDHLRVLGSLCYVVLPPQLVPAGGKLAYKGVILGYADDNERGQKAYVVRRLDNGKMMTATYSQTHNHEGFFPYRRKEDDDDCIDVYGDEHDDVKRPMNDTETDNESYETDNETSERDSAESSSSDEELAADSLKKASGAEALTPARGESADDASCGSDNTQMRSNANEREHDGDGKAELVGTDSHDTTDNDDNNDDDNKHDDEHVDIYSDNEDVMENVSDMVRDLDEAARAQPTHRYKLRQRKKGLSKQELKKERKSRGPVPACSDDAVSANTPRKSTRKSKTPHPSPRKSRTPQYEVTRVIDVSRTGKKGNGKLVFRVLWDSGEKTWERAEMFVGGAELALRAFLRILTRKQITLFKPNELDGLHDLMKCENGEESEEEESEEKESMQYSAVGERRRKKRLNERFDILKAIVKIRQKTALGQTVPNTLKQMHLHPKTKEFCADMQVEFDNFMKKGVWRLVLRPASDVNVVSVRWVFDIKTKNGEVTRYKARLVCRGYAQREGEDYDPTELYAPTMKTKTLRTLTALAAQNGWDMNQYDVSCAFLHADLEETVYVEQPPEHVIAGKEDYVYILDKAMYGLKQSPRAFAKHLAKCFRQLHFKQSDADECLWILKNRDGVMVYALYHVDDIIMMSDDNNARDNVFELLRCFLDIRDEGRVDVFLNMKFEYGSDGSISLSQAHYIEKMAARFGVTDDDEDFFTPGTPDDVLSKDDLPVTDEEQRQAAKLPYPALVGSLIYVVLCRPDACFSISNSAMYMSRWGVKHYEHAMRILKYLYTTRHEKLTYRRWTGPVELTCYVDANYGDKRDSGNNDKWCSQGGYLMFVGDCLVSWCSKRQRCRTLSSMEAEYVEAARGGQEVVWFRRLLGDLGYPQEAPTIMWEDNKAAIAFSKNQTCHDRSKHIDIRVYWLRDLVLAGSIVMLHIPTGDQLADFLTKHLRKPGHEKARDTILGGRPLGRNKGELVNVVTTLDRFLGDKHTFSARNSMMTIGDIDCY
jgi:transposase InsO family protein